MNRNVCKIVVIAFNILLPEGLPNVSIYIEHRNGSGNWNPVIKCNKTFLFIENIRKYKWGPLCSAEPLDLSKKNERELLVDLQHRCNGIDACVMDDFFMPEVAIKCNNNPQITKNIDAEFTCKPHVGEIVHIVNERNKSFVIENTKNQLHHLIFNVTRNTVCEISRASDNFTVTLFYVQWERTTRCENSKEYVSIQNNTFTCNKTEPITMQVNKSQSIQININKSSGLVWIELKASRAKNVTCDFKDRESDSSTGNGQVLTINEIILLTVIPVSFVVAITVTCLALYRCGIICKSNRKNTNDILTKNGSIQDDINYNSTITVSDIQGQRTSQTVDVYSDIDAKSPVKNTNYHQLDKSVKRSDEFKETADTYAVVRKVQRTPNSNVEFQISISSVPHGNTSNEVSNDYAHFGQVQGRTFQTENVYGAVHKVRHAIFDDF